jgi:uncharacterized protein YuzE
MAIRDSAALVLQYDEPGDVLYASLGAPQPALTDEVEDDVWLRYCPPQPEVVGITVLNFRRHFPQEEPADVIRQVLEKYPVVPWPLEP